MIASENQKSQSDHLKILSKANAHQKTKELSARPTKAAIGEQGDSNPRPLAPKARIIPLDHVPEFRSNGVIFVISIIYIVATKSHSFPFGTRSLHNCRSVTFTKHAQLLNME